MNIATNIGAIRINLFVIDELNSSGNDQLKDTTYENYCTNDKCNGDPAQAYIVEHVNIKDFTVTIIVSMGVNINDV
ncbi:hypothetical protein PBNK65E_000497900 [Plasmodium berghei]|uniref:Uncharacterized protein n=1 Tax=Plasmodium berghei TaxID=5821 RepID=A0A122I1R6_PLABE|nr:hypothetical protein PBK173_000118700 [Plasmodium berghei]SBW38152.1 hypothetical protein PBNK65E_000497900 [Plasmodium berghei]SCL81892.1 hypothetical protein PBSP11RLL_000494900 [Plasmodium berghei]SCL82189.1 hypothetical protein PBNK65NY_000493000 [Plasmodium berghei]SCL82441.1 hypothetical protein PBSP11A_000495200 [Plasmodium berghei]